MSASIVVQFDQLRSVVAGAGTLDGTWREIIKLGGAAGSGLLEHSVRLMKIQNVTTTDVYISFNFGTNTHDMIPAGGFALYDFTSNKATSGGDFQLPDNQYIYAKTANGAAATGSYLTVTVVYGKGE